MKGVEVCFFLQFGYLGEGADEIRATLSMLKDLNPHDIGISVSYPLPGTKFYDKVKNMLGEKQNWAVSDDLDMMYPATYAPAFYKRLHRMTHKTFRLHQGLEEWQKLLDKGRCSPKKALMTFYYAPALLVDQLRLKRLAGGKF